VHDSAVEISVWNLAAAREAEEHLRSLVESKEASDEEFQSANEEILSANEGITKHERGIGNLERGAPIGE
jgi:hypothetical protein